MSKPDRPTPTRAIARQATSAVAYTAPEPAADDPLLAFAPYLHKQPRSNSITPDKQRKFIASLAATGIVTQAAMSIGKSMEALYKLRNKPGAEGFASAWDAALERGVQRLEDCALERAIQGTPTPIVSHGKVLGTWDKPDNTLLRFLLQHRLAEKYGTQKLTPGHPVYESIRAEVLAEVEARKEETRRAAAPPEPPAPVPVPVLTEEQQRQARARALLAEDPDYYAGLTPAEIAHLTGQPAPEGAENPEEFGDFDGLSPAEIASLTGGPEV